MTLQHAAVSTRRVAYFITPHGFGHAARAASVMAALQDLAPTVRCEIFTQVPRWFFEDSLPQPFGYHALLSDIGLVQKTSLLADMPATLQRLQEFLPFDPALVTTLAHTVRTLGCALVLCDIAPLGIAVAQAAGLPSVLIENFTWDWIYAAYAQSYAQMEFYISYLQEIFSAAEYRIQTEPVCAYHAADLVTQPASRKPTASPASVRQRLELPSEARVVLITMGGIPMQYPFLQQLATQPDISFIIPGASESIQRYGNTVLLPHRTGLFHPNLVNACDAVIGKVGYSTLAEVYHAGLPFGYIARQEFRESPCLVAYIAQHMPGLAITPAQFDDGSWLSQLPQLLALPLLTSQAPNGADQAARFIHQLLYGEPRSVRTTPA
jgi:hypothetical protein